jgi:hypothetical protein
MASKYRYDNDEEETQRPTLPGLLKVLLHHPRRLLPNPPN